MKIALMQPYFFPYVGYFSLIKQADQFVIFDSAQYIRRGWMNRNRILNANGTVSYINVPIEKAAVATSIKDIKIKNSIEWKEKIYGQLGIYKNAPYYNQIKHFLHELLEYETDSLCDLNVYLLRKICDYLNIDHNIGLLSDLNLSLDSIKESDEWGLYVTKALNGQYYLNPPGGMAFYDREKYKRNKINIQFVQNNLREYDQKRHIFEPGLSIIDVMMFNNQNEIHNILNDFQLL